MPSRLMCLAAFAVAFFVSSTLAQGPIPGSIPKGPERIELFPAATGLLAPNGLVTQPGSATRHFISDQQGHVRILENGTLLATPFLDISSSAAVVADRRVISLTAGYDERGLLGFAFDPNFNTTGHPGFGRVFTYTSEATTGGTADYTQVNGTPNHHSVITSWKVDPLNLNRIDTSTRQELLRFDEPQSNHNGGNIAFGPDGFLYIASGDGGSANDKATGHIEPTGNGQNTNTPLGKVMRIDVNGNNSNNGKYGIPAGNPFSSGVGGIKEIYATGFRNPFRFSFDGNDLYVADVGQNTIEEVDKVEVGKNYGWRYKEGSFFFNPDAPNTVSATPINGVTPGTPGAPVAVMPAVEDPIIEYDRDDNGVVKRISIIGGFVYRGSALPSLQGKYIFGDFSSSFGTPNGTLYYADLLTGDINQFIIGNDDRNLGLFVKGIGQDASGELYVLASTNLGPSGSTGQVLRIIPVPEPALGLPIAMIALALRRRR